MKAIKTMVLSLVAVGVLAGCGSVPTATRSSVDGAVSAQGLFSRIKDADYESATASDLKLLAQGAGLQGVSARKLKFSGKLSVSSKGGLLGDARRAPMALVLIAGASRIELMERGDVGFKTPDVYLFDKFKVGRKDTVTAYVTIAGGTLEFDGVRYADGSVEKP